MGPIDNARRSRTRQHSIQVFLAICMVASASLVIDRAGGVDPSCDTFTSQAKAQEYFLANGGPAVDTHSLDADNNGIACDHRPAPYKGTLTIEYVGRAFTGTYVAGTEDCFYRSVNVLKLRKGKPPKKIGSSEVDEYGRYSVPSTDSRGTFVAKIAKTSTCTAEASPKFVVAFRRLELRAPEGLFFTAPGEVRPLEAWFIDDATGAETAATNVWFRSSDPSNFSVSRDGWVTANTENTSAQISAAAEGVSSDALLAVTTTVPSDAIQLTDSQIETLPTFDDAEPTFDSTFIARLVLDEPPQEDKIYVATGSEGLLGRVVKYSEVDAGVYEVMFAQVPLPDALPGLNINEAFDFGTGPVDIDPETAAAFDVTRSGTTTTFTEKGLDGLSTRSSARAAAADGPCKVTAGPSGVLKFESRKISIDVKPRGEVIIEDGALQWMSIDVEPVVTYEAGYTIQSAVEASVTCKFKLEEIQRPAPGLIGFVLGMQIPFHLVLTGSGKLILESFTVKQTTTLSGKAHVDVDCFTECEVTSSAHMDDPITTIKTDKSSVLGDGARFEPSISALVRISPALGVHQTEKARITLAEVDLGAKVSGKFGTMNDQADSELFASEYKMQTVTAAKFLPQVSGVSDLAKKLKIDGVTGNSFALDPYEIGRSPQGSLGTDNLTFHKGEKVVFRANLYNTKFIPCCGPYNVERVLLLHRDDQTNEIKIVDTEHALPGQKQFLLTWVADSKGGFAEHEFWAFAVTELVPFEDLAIEIAKAQKIFTCHARDGAPTDGTRC